MPARVSEMSNKLIALHFIKRARCLRCKISISRLDFWSKIVVVWAVL